MLEISVMILTGVSLAMLLTRKTSATVYKIQANTTPRNKNWTMDLLDLTDDFMTVD